MYLLKLIYQLSFLRLIKLVIGFIILVSIAIPLIVVASTDNLQKLLKSELNIEASEQVLKNLDSPKRIQIEHELGMLRLGRNLFSGPTAGENAIRIFTQLIESEATPDVLSFSFNHLIEIIEETAENTTSMAVAKSIRQINDIPKYALVWGEIQAMKEIPRERLILYYVNKRIEGKDDSAAWNSLLTIYASYEQELGVKFSEGSIGILSGQIGAQINILKDPIQSEAVHAEAEYTYNSYIIAEEINDNPEAKEKLIQEIQTSINEANRIEENKPGLLFHVWETITKPFKFLWNKIVSLFTKNKAGEQPAQVGSSLKNGYQDCPAYILVTAEYIKTKTEVSVIQEKIKVLNIGNAMVRLVNGVVFISITNADIESFTPVEPAYQKLVNALQKLGLQETKMTGGSAYQTKDCSEIEQNFLRETEQENITPQSNIQNSQQPQIQQGKITALVVSPDGQPVYQAKFWLVDSQGQLVEKSAGGVVYDAIRYTTQTGNLETLTVPNGQYTLNVACAANCMFGDKFAQSIVNDIYAKWSKTLPVEVKESDIWLDKIILIRER